MSVNDLFAVATRKAFRFPSVRGQLTTEDVWQLPLTSKTGFDLDSVARAVNVELKSLTEDSFVSVKENPAKAEVAAKLEILKTIIEVKQDEAKKAQLKVKRAEDRRKILDALAAKEDQELTSASKDDLLKRLAELDD